MLGCGVNLSTGILALEQPRRFRPRSASAYVLPGATWYEIQYDVQMAAICADIGGTQERPNCEPSPVAASAEVGAN